MRKQFYFFRKPIYQCCSIESCVFARDIALASNPYCEGERVKTCMLKAVEIVCLEKRQAFANSSQIRNTRGAARIFPGGGGGSSDRSKSLEKEELFVIGIVREST